MIEGKCWVIQCRFKEGFLTFKMRDDLHLQVTSTPDTIETRASKIKFSWENFKFCALYHPTALNHTQAHQTKHVNFCTFSPILTSRFSNCSPARYLKFYPNFSAAVCLFDLNLWSFPPEFTAALKSAWKGNGLNRKTGKHQKWVRKRSKLTNLNGMKRLKMKLWEEEKMN